MDIYLLNLSFSKNKIHSEKPQPTDYEKTKQGKKLYYFFYLKKVFQTAGRNDLIDKLLTYLDKPDISQQTSEDTNEDNPESSQA